MAEVAAVVALVAIAITALPGLDQVRDRLQHARPVWLAGAALAEVASCLGYVLAFRATFCPQMSWGLSYDIAMAEQAANSLLPSGGAGGWRSACGRCTRRAWRRGTSPDARSRFSW